MKNGGFATFESPHVSFEVGLQGFSNYVVLYDSKAILDKNDNRDQGRNDAFVFASKLATLLGCEIVEQSYVEKIQRIWEKSALEERHKPKC